MSVEAGTILRVVAELLMPQSTVMQNVYYTMFNDTGGSNSDEDVVDDLRDWCEDIYTELVDEMKNTIVAGEVKVYVWDTTGLDWDELGSANMSVTFLNATDMLPHGVAAVMTGRTYDPDVNGRKFFGGFGEDTQVGSILQAAAITALVLAGAEWITTFTGAATGSTFYPGVWSVVQLTFRRFVENLIMNTVLGYQRRRKPGVGI